MRYALIRPVTASRLFAVILLALALISCGKESAVDKGPGEKAKGLAGTWTLQARIADGREVPANERFMKIVLNEDGTFRALYRGEKTQNWIVAGQGGYSYTPPSLHLHWDSGQVVNMLVVEAEPNRLRLHHGTALTPLKDQEPDDVFVRETGPKGPTRSPSS